MRRQAYELHRRGDQVVAGPRNSRGKKSQMSMRWLSWALTGDLGDPQTSRVTVGENRVMPDRADTSQELNDFLRGQDQGQPVGL